MIYLVGYSLLVALVLGYIRLLKHHRGKIDRMTIAEKREHDEAMDDLRTW